MPQKKHSELVAGLFVLAGLALVLGVVMWLGAADVFARKYGQVCFYINQGAGSSGLAIGAFVKLNDNNIGQITRMDIDAAHKRTIYVADLSRSDVKVHSDGKASVSAGLIGGAALIVTDLGTPQAPLADEKNPVELGGASFESIMQSLAKAGENAAQVSEVLRKEMDATNSSALLSKMHEIIDSLVKAGGDVSKIATAISSQADVAKADSLMAKIHKAASDVADMMADAKPKVSETLTNLDQTSGKINDYTKKDIGDLLATVRQIGTELLKTATNFADTSSQVREMVILNRDNIDEMVDNLTQVSANLKAAAKEVRRNPWRLLYTPSDKEIHSQNIFDAARSFSTGAEQLDQAVTKLNALSKAKPEGVPVNDPELQKIRKDIQESFEKFTKVEQALWKELNAK